MRLRVCTLGPQKQNLVKWLFRRRIGQWSGLLPCLYIHPVAQVLDPETHLLHRMDSAAVQHVVISAIVGYFILRLMKWLKQWKKSPFASDSRKPRTAPYVYDQRERAKVLKQNFSIEKVSSCILEILHS